MTKIYKHVLYLQEWQTILTPRDSEMLDVQLQHGNIALWCQFDHTREVEAWMVWDVFIAGTGHVSMVELKREWYVGTVQIADFVWHVYAKRAG